ncbi:MAG: DoxX family protein [Acidimicrobiales bacterium]
MFIAALVLSILLAVAFIGAGGSKLANASQSVAQRDTLGVSAARWRAIGALEIAGAAGLLLGLGVAPLGAAAGIGLAALMAGAVVTHVRAKDIAHAPPAIALGRNGRRDRRRPHRLVMSPESSTPLLAEWRGAGVVLGGEPLSGQQFVLEGRAEALGHPGPASRQVKTMVSVRRSRVRCPRSTQP